MSSTDSFRTKRGIATLGDGKLEIEGSFRGYIQSLYHAYWESNVRWRKAVFVCLVFSPVIAIVWLIGAFAAGRFLLLATVLGLTASLWVISYMRGFRSPDQLRIDQIVAVAATRGQKGMTRPRLVLTYREGTETYKRRVNLPSLYTPHGEATYDRAVAAFRKRGFDVE